MIDLGWDAAHNNQRSTILITITSVQSIIKRRAVLPQTAPADSKTTAH
jgi:hypothetical protein